MRECAVFCGKDAGVEVIVTKGTPERWIEEARRDADPIYGGAEYMLTDLDRDYPLH